MLLLAALFVSSLLVAHLLAAAFGLLLLHLALLEGTFLRLLSLLQAHGLLLRLLLTVLLAL